MRKKSKDVNGGGRYGRKVLEQVDPVDLLSPFASGLGDKWGFYQFNKYLLSAYEVRDTKKLEYQTKTENLPSRILQANQGNIDQVMTVLNVPEANCKNSLRHLGNGSRERLASLKEENHAIWPPREGAAGAKIRQASGTALTVDLGTAKLPI